MIEIDDVRAQRLAGAVRRRRRELGEPSQIEVALRAEISVATYQKIEAGIPGRYQPRTLDRLARGLGWHPGSVDQVINGGDPLPDDVPEVRVQHVRIDGGAVHHRTVANLPEDEFDRLRRRWERIWRRFEDDPGRATAVIGGVEAILDGLDALEGDETT